MAAYDLFATNQYWVVAGFNMDFEEELPFWSEEIQVEIWISEVSKLKIYTDFKIYHDNKVFSKGNALWFIIDKETKRPIRADIVSERFEICNELVLGEHKKFELPEKTDIYNQITHQNNLSDLDFNNHVNNKSYINLADMTTKTDFKETHQLKQLNIKFNKETFLGDVLKCITYNSVNSDTLVHIVEKDGESVCDITTEWTKRKNTLKIENATLKVQAE